ncbi:MAG: homing endonuclease associated repeat-containing protein [Candidatus Aenigmatarchaeota archaeon]
MSEKYTDDYLIEKLQEKAEELGRVPTRREVNADKDIPSVYIYTKTFGSYNKALEAAGLNVNKEYYSDQELLELLKKKAKELGRTPTQKEITADKSIPSSTTYRYRFGSLTNALKEAGLDRNREYYSKEELIEYLQKKAEELGRTPTTEDIKADKSMPNPSTYIKWFGSYNKALEAAGIELNRDFKHEYSEQELIELLQNKAKELGKTPSKREIDRDKSMPRSSTYMRKFGSWNNALEEACLEIHNYTQEKLIEVLQHKADDLGRAPTAREIETDKNMPGVNTYCKHFGSWNSALKAAGLESKYREYSNEELIKALKEKAKELGRPPTTMEMNKDKSIPSAHTYNQRFGSFNKALKEAGLDINCERKDYTDEELLELLKDKAEELGRTPTIEEVIKDDSMPYPGVYYKRFGSWKNAVKEAGLEPYMRVYKKKYTDQELLDFLRKKAEELGRTPLKGELNTDKSIPNQYLYRKRFGSWEIALKKAGLKPNKKTAKKRKRSLTEKLLEERL